MTHPIFWNTLCDALDTHQIKLARRKRQATSGQEIVMDELDTSVYGEDGWWVRLVQWRCWVCGMGRLRILVAWTRTRVCPHTHTTLNRLCCAHREQGLERLLRR